MTYKTTSRSSGYPSTTATARVCENLAMYGHTPHADEPEYRPIPDDADLQGSVETMFSALTGTLTDTALEDSLPEILWSLVYALYRAEDNINKLISDNGIKLRECLHQQDGSEVKDVELQTLTMQAQQLEERRAGLEHMRTHGETAYYEAVGKAWRPKSGSLLYRNKPQSAAIIDGKAYLAGKRRAEAELINPTGTKVAFAGGLDFEDYKTAYAVLDEIKARIPDMVLLHGGADKGADRIADTWAKARGVSTIAFKPEWNRHQNAAPFKRNDAMLAAQPEELVVFPGNGITDNIADKAKKFGIRLTDKRGRVA